MPPDRYQRVSFLFLRLGTPKYRWELGRRVEHYTTEHYITSITDRKRCSLVVKIWWNSIFLAGLNRLSGPIIAWRVR